MQHRISLSASMLAALLLVALAGCSTIAEKTNFMSDGDIKAKVAGPLGYTPDDVTLVSRRTEGTDTNVVVRVKNSKEFACTLNGGNLLSGGIINTPTCAPKM